VHTVLLAHQGGWDEGLYILGTLGVLAFLVRLANRRADRYRTEMDAHETAPPACPDPTSEPDRDPPLP
jgi:hypothetical protein